MDDNSDSVMIALLPTRTDWSSLELPHVTLVYAGQFKDLSEGEFNAIAKDAVSIATLTRPFSLQVTGVEVFGGDGDNPVDVLTLQPTTQLLALRNIVENWNASQHDFSPHATIGPEGSSDSIVNMPSFLTFDRIAACWGDTRLIYPLRNISALMD